MNEAFLEQLISEHLDVFAKKDPNNAEHIHKAWGKWVIQEEALDLLTWWKEQGIPWIASLQSFLFWLWTEGKIEYQMFELSYDVLTPITAKSWSMPIVITTGEDDPLFEDGFINRNFKVDNYTFSPSNRGLLVTCQEYPQSFNTNVDLDLILDFLSFLLGKFGVGYLGFRQIKARKTVSSSTKIVEKSMGPKIQTMLDFDFELIGNGLTRIARSTEGTDFSLRQLLRARHRAILDSTLESKLVTLWSFVEAMWGHEDKKDRLFTDEERGKIKEALDFLPRNKFSKAINHISKLKKKTKNDKIIEESSNLNCASGWDVAKTIRGIHALRSKFAHGGMMRPHEQAETKRYISFMFGIIDELITRISSEHKIEF